MRYRFTTGTALLGALALSLAHATVPAPAGASVPRPVHAHGPAQAAVGDPLGRGQLPRLRLTFPAPVRWRCRGPASRGRAGGV
jgi:hypothetical protein